MTRVESAPRDVIFFLHHCYIDYIWWQWQSDNRNRTFTWRYPTNSQPGHGARDPILNLRIRRRPVITNGEGYTRVWAFSFVNYRRSPDCSRRTCNGQYLRCKPGGTRWEWSWELWRWRRVTTRSLCMSVPRGGGSNTQRRKRSLKENRVNKGKSSEKYVHTSLYHSWDAPYEATSHKEYPSIEKSESLKVPKPTFKLGEHPGLKDIHGHPVQNDFRINCEQDTSLWAFLPIKVVHLRPFGKIYDSYPVTNGYLDPNIDIYSDLMFRTDINYTKPQNPTCFKNCIEDDAGYSRITIRSDGLNYNGLYHEYIIIDNRQPIDSHVGYIGFRRPDKKASEVLITAQDQCGRICIPKCLKKGSNPPEYEPCSGAIKVDSKKPRHYGETYSDAVLKYWSFKKEGCPTEREGEVYLKFYCDYKTRWFPWPGASKKVIY
ncbi:hypothetical protein FSP39_010858 [Pinctada imbricata]|uniref:Tyrosinase copper-binding domain-containing protein n=1 Tax=Pinctada imbricata TaxID=66713 RepID=A0AA89BPR0_PINIB|nr:hypothetical protein FSP39_010858 [Pinctada imbricata]